MRFLAMLIRAIRHPLRTILLLYLAVLVCLYLVQTWLGLFIILAVILLMVGRVPARFAILLVVATGLAIMQLGRVVPTGAAVGLPLGLLFLVVLAFPVRRWWLAHVHRPKPHARGARWAQWSELRREGFFCRHGWPIGTVGRHTVRLPMFREREGILAIAPPGSYKTSALAIPALLSETERPRNDLRSLVIGDPKDELTRVTIAAISRTHRVCIWHPSNIELPKGIPADWSVGFDPLRTLPDQLDNLYLDEVRDLSDSWFWATRKGENTTDPFFITQPLSLMRCAVLTYLCFYPAGTFVGLGWWVRSMTFDDFLGHVQAATSPYVRSFAGAMRSLALNERAVGGIWADIQQRFDILETPSIRAAMDPSRNPIDWQKFVSRPTAIFLVVAARDSEALQPLLSLFLARMYRSLITIAARNNNVLPREVRVLIDEFGNLSRIYGMETSLASLRSFGVGHYLFIQTTAQLRRHYGQDLARAIQDNLVTKLCLGGAADEDAKWFSARVGETTTYHPNSTYSANGALHNTASHGHSPDRLALITPTDIMHMSGTVLLSTRGIPPVRAKLRPYYKDRRVMARLEAATSVLSAGSPLWPDPGPKTAPDPLPPPLPFTTPRGPII